MSNRHPLTGLPPVGYINGRPIWPIMGGSEAPPETKPDDQQQQQTPPDDPAPPDWATMFEGMTPAQVKEALDNSRKWESNSKKNFTKAQQLDALLKVLNPGTDSPDPQKLAADLTSAQRDVNQTKIENEVLRTAARHGADPVRLSDSRTFMNKVSNLDPSSPDFTSKVAAAIKKSVEDDETLRISRGPKSNPFQGKNGDDAPPSLGREQGLAEARKRFGPKQ